MKRTLNMLLAVCTAASSAAVSAAEFRSFDGSGNNLAHPDWGAADTNFARLAPVDYADGISTARLAGRPNPRSVGLSLMRQSAPRPNARNLSGYVYAFGNFLSHDSQRTVSTTLPNEFVNFTIPFGDDIFGAGQGVQVRRSLFDTSTGTSLDNPRQQVNLASAFIDASHVYGSDELSASILRGGPANPGAKLMTSNDINGDAENLLPRNAFGPNPRAPFVAGDDRVNDNIILTAMHTLFLREHNRLVDHFAAVHPEWTSEELYQRARKTVGAQLQAITYNEFLPALLGPHAPAPTGVYNPDLNPAVLNEFPVIFLRIGHSMLTKELERVHNDGSREAPLSLVLSLFDPARMTTSTDLDLFLNGLTFEVQEETDLKMVDAMRIALLDAIDIQRARDHGLPDYNTLREAYGLPRVASFAEISSDPAVRSAIAAIYPNVNSIDPFVGALAEDHLPGASVGPLVAAGYRVQFERLRDGDRFWYEHDPDFTPEELNELRNTTLSRIIQRNTGLTNLPANVFFAVPEPAGGGVAAVFLAGALPMRFRRRPRPAQTPAYRPANPVI